MLCLGCVGATPALADSCLPGSTVQFKSAASGAYAGSTPQARVESVNYQTGAKDGLTYAKAAAKAANVDLGAAGKALNVVETSVKVYAAYDQIANSKGVLPSSATESTFTAAGAVVGTLGKLKVLPPGTASISSLAADIAKASLAVDVATKSQTGYAFARAATASINVVGKSAAALAGYASTGGPAAADKAVSAYEVSQSALNTAVERTLDSRLARVDARAAAEEDQRMFEKLRSVIERKGVQLPQAATEQQKVGYWAETERSQTPVVVFKP